MTEGASGAVSERGERDDDRERDGRHERGESRERTLSIGEESPIRISAGHRLRHHDGKCARPHGHNYQVSVEVTGTLTDAGWVVDKSAVTDVVEEWDHRFLLEAGDPLVEAFEDAGDGDAVVVLQRPPTAEVLSVVLEDRLLTSLPETVSDVSVAVRETDELCATY